MLNACPKTSNEAPKNHEVILGFCSIYYAYHHPTFISPQHIDKLYADKSTYIIRSHHSINDQLLSKQLRNLKSVKSENDTTNPRSDLPPIISSHDHYHKATSIYLSLSDPKPNSSPLAHHPFRPSSFAHPAPFHQSPQSPLLQSDHSAKSSIPNLLLTVSFPSYASGTQTCVAFTHAVRSTIRHVVVCLFGERFAWAQCVARVSAVCHVGVDA
jgi:hypothetical protein